MDKNCFSLLKRGYSVADSSATPMGRRRSMDSLCSSDNENFSDHATDTEANVTTATKRSTPFFITLETQDGKLEQVPVSLDDKDEDSFTNKRALLHYLASSGVILTNQNVPKRKRNGSGGSNNVAGNLSSISNEELELELQKRVRESRSDSIVTPGLIESLKKNRRRIVSKNGQCNIELKKVPQKRVQFVKDIFTTAVDMPWRYTLLSFAWSFFFSWLIFAFLWWLIAFTHGDLETVNLPEGPMQSNGSFVPCVWQIYGFTSCFLFSIETQHTIGYGSRSTSEECPHAIIIMCLQSIIGVVISACMSGIVFVKLARPKQRSNTIMYSKNAVVTQRNGDLYLLFRVGNLRKSHLIEAHLRAQMVKQRTVTKEGESLHYDHEELKISCQTNFNDEEKTLLLWPSTVAHKIDETSPFYSMYPKDLLVSRFELIVSLEGTVEPTGNGVQVLSSYLPNEILWGYHFENMMSYSKKRGVYSVDCSCLNALVQDDTPRISAKDLNERKKKEAKEKNFFAKSPTTQSPNMNLLVSPIQSSPSQRKTQAAIQFQPMSDTEEEV